LLLTTSVSILFPFKTIPCLKSATTSSISQASTSSNSHSTRSRMTQYRKMSKKKKRNLVSQITDQQNAPIQSLRILLRNIWLSCYNHQQQLVIGRVCAVYASQRSYQVWDQVIPTLLAVFQVPIGIIIGAILGRYHRNRNDCCLRTLFGGDVQLLYLCCGKLVYCNYFGCLSARIFRFILASHK
jgi:hypothetical protein